MKGRPSKLETREKGRYEINDGSGKERKELK